ncbi:MAG: FkbM family methyltransferase [Candidatus Babeliaceae bacterium]|nr:FkbM family methyltransferase [Candidatus Babeliaceae bacterium]
MKNDSIIKIISIFVLSSCFLECYVGQFNQDGYLNENVFKGKRNGVFVDIGAHDGISISNTYFFEKQLGWTGICIEPIPEVYERLCQNRTCITVCGAISTFNGKSDFLKVSGYAEMLSGLVKNYDSRHLSRIDWECNHYKGSKKVIEVECYKLNDLLEKYGLYTIDYLTLDIEGGELDVLKSIDFDVFNIHVIDVENNYNDSKIKKFLLSKGYKLLHKLGVDELYIKDNSSLTT